MITADSGRGADANEALVGEALRILEGARPLDLDIRLLGGVAVAIRCPSAATPALRREYKDVDFVARSRDRDGLDRLFAEAGYSPEAEFNAYHGLDRLIYRRDDGGQADVFLDAVAMCHRLELAERLTLDEETLTPADLLLLKLQVVETNERDLKDAVALLADHPTGDEGIDADYVAGLLAGDWGWWRTATLVLDRVIRFGEALPDPVGSRAGERARSLLERIDAEPKSRRWKLRARVGERLRWYDEPDETH